MLELTHHDDSKKKWQSPEVSMCDKTEYGLQGFDFGDIYGYGATYDEALEEFKKKFDEHLERLKAFSESLFTTDALVPIEVDCLGKPIEKR